MPAQPASSHLTFMHWLGRLLILALLLALTPHVLYAAPTVGDRVVGWGDNRSNQTAIPAGLSGIVQVAAGFSHSLALRSDGTVVAWGANGLGQTNIPSTLSNVVQVAAGLYHNLALQSDGTVTAWGYNLSGQMDIPPGLNGVTQVAAGNTHNLALRSDGTVVAWGANGLGQCNVPPGLTGVVQVAVGAYHSLALKSDGTVVAWGNNNYGQAAIPAGLTGVVQVAAGGFHSLALKSNGTVVVWGNNDYQQTNIPQGLSDVVEIAAGYVHNLALRSDGTLVAWGDNQFRQATIPTNLTRVVQVAAGGYHSLAILKQELLTVQWSTPAPISYGTALGTSQLNAVANVPGTMSYSPPEGTVLSAGAGQVLTATFMPNSSAYTSATITTTITVDPALLTVTAANQTMRAGDPLPPLRLSYSGFVLGENTNVLDTQPTARTTATRNSPPGQYPITVGGGSDPNYSFAYQSGTLTITADSGRRVYLPMIVR
jgi:hypothetical protein